MPVELFANTATTTLAAAITDAVGTSVSVASSALFPAAVAGVSQFRVKIDTEIMIVTNVAGTTWTVTRGAESTTAATHASAAPVTHALTAGVLAGLGVVSPPDVRPASPSAYDDEFDTFSGWTTLGTLDTLNVTDFPGKIHMKQASSGAFNVYGIFKACPSIPFTVTAKVSDMCFGQNYQTSALMLAEAVPGKLLVSGVLDSSGLANFGMGLWNSRTSRLSFPVDITSFSSGFVPMYLRMVVTSSTVVGTYRSKNGFAWTGLQTINPGFTIGSVGLAVSGQDNSVLLDSVFDWIRFT